MKIAGMIFNDRERMEKLFHEHAARVMFTCDTGYRVSASKREIEACGIKWKYIFISNDDQLNNISGIQFDAIFSEVTNVYHKQYIMTRFRPGLN